MKIKIDFTFDGTTHERTIEIPEAKVVGIDRSILDRGNKRLRYVVEEYVEAELLNMVDYEWEIIGDAKSSGDATTPKDTP